MRWTPGGSRGNLEDRRGQKGGIGGRSMGVGGGIVLLVLSLIFGVNLFDGGGAPGPVTSSEGTAGPVTESAEEAELVEFVNFVLNDAQAVWGEVLPRHGQQYRDARLVLFREVVQSGCGVAESAMGPFYCPADERVYIDLGFFEALDSQLRAGGDFAQAYVLAHEIGHHVQHILGTNARVRQLQESRPADANELSVRMELQADCYAGVWGHSTGQRRLLEAGDMEEGLGAAAAVGDDRIQRSSRGSINPESFTHGTSEQRMGWFRRGFDSGDPQSCDTFVGAI